jgi:hypothetical protein
MPVAGQTPTRIHLVDSTSVTWVQIGAAYPDPNDPTKLVRDVQAFAPRLQIDDLSAACNGTNTAFTLSQTPKQMLGVVLKKQFHVPIPGGDFSVTGTTLNTAFTDAGGNVLPPGSGEKLYAMYFY